MQVEILASPNEAEETQGAELSANKFSAGRMRRIEPKSAPTAA
jgi:hypothetical protein